MRRSPEGPRRKSRLCRARTDRTASRLLTYGPRSPSVRTDNPRTSSIARYSVFRSISCKPWGSSAGWQNEAARPRREEPVQASGPRLGQRDHDLGHRRHRPHTSQPLNPVPRRRPRPLGELGRTNVAAICQGSKSPTRVRHDPRGVASPPLMAEDSGTLVKPWQLGRGMSVSGITVYGTQHRQQPARHRCEGAGVCGAQQMQRWLA